MSSFLLLLALPASSAEFETLEVSSADGVYRVEVVVVLDVPVEPVRRVLTDYDHLWWITGAIKTSQHLDSPTEGVHTVFTESRVCFLFFCKTIEQVQRVDETNPLHIVSRALPEYSDVKRSEAHWILEPLDGEQRTRMHWTLEMEPDFFIPPLIGPSVVKDALLEEGQASARGIEKLARERMNR
ncbi:MAG: SRPBCC family protein [Gammaproteobacteria bacterium]|nr:SRPBCC family protein [Gammaproteobacteria bacterium]